MVCILHTVLHHSIDDKWIFFGFLHENLLIFGLCKKISAPGQNQRDERDHSAFGRGCVMRDCRIERNGTVGAPLSPRYMDKQSPKVCG